MDHEETLMTWIERSVESGTTSVEQIHKSIADLPWKVMERNGLLEEAAAEVRKIQDRSIGAVYDVIREVNHQVAQFTSHLLGDPAPSRGDG